MGTKNPTGIDWSNIPSGNMTAMESQVLKDGARQYMDLCESVREVARELKDLRELLQTLIEAVKIGS